MDSSTLCKMGPRIWFCSPTSIIMQCSSIITWLICRKYSEIYRILHSSPMKTRLVWGVCCMDYAALFEMSRCIQHHVITDHAKTGSWASYQIRKIAGCACAGNAGNVFPRHRIQWKPRISDPGMHHGTCVTHVPWCMSGLLTHGGGKTFPAFPAHAHPQFYVLGKRLM